MAKIKYTIKVGDTFSTTYSGEVVVLNYAGNTKITIQFKDGRTKIVASKELRSGKVKNNFQPYIHGVGFMGEGEYKAKAISQKSGSTPEYEVWRGMLRRCYDPVILEKRPTYIDCVVDEAWHNFQNFAKWYTSQKGFNERWHLDKDLLKWGNKVYSEQNCCLIPSRVNSLFTGASKIKRGNCPKGVHWDKHKKMFVVQIHRDGTQQDYLGQYSTKEKAFAVYKTAKEIYVKQVAEEYRKDLPDEVYENLINYVVNIYD